MASNQKVLTPADAKAIYARAHTPGERQTDIAADFSISQATVSCIKRGYYWSEVTGHQNTRPETDSQARIKAIYDAYWVQKLPVKMIAELYGVSLHAVYEIRNGTTGAKYTGHPFPKPRKKKVAAK